MKIALFTDSYYPHVSGVAKTVERYINYLEKNGHEYILFLPAYSFKDKNDSNQKKSLGLKFLLYPELRFSFVNYITLKKSLDDFQPDIIQVMTEFPIGRSGIWYGKKRGIPIVTCFETNVPQYMEYYGFGMLTETCWNFYKWFHRYSDMVVTPSEITTQLLKKQHFHKVWTWQRGIEFDKFNPEYRSDEVRRKFGPEDGVLFIYVGRLAVEKDLNVFLDTAKILREKYGNKINFAIVGGGPVLEELKKDAPDFITFTGFLRGNDLLELYASADVFLFPSPTETLGFVILEAMASQLPVIACFEGGVRDTLVDGYNGIACREKNVDDFVQASIKLIDDEPLRKQLGLNAREFAKSKDWDKSFEGLLNLYRQVTDSKKLKLRKKTKKFSDYL